MSKLEEKIKNEMSKLIICSGEDYETQGIIQNIHNLMYSEETYKDKYNNNPFVE